MFWDRAACVYDLFANVVNRRANRALCDVVAGLILPTDEALECACGTGLLSGVIARRCKSLIATDFSANMLRRAEKKYGRLGNVKFERADILRLDFPDGRFNVVVAANVIHLLDEPYKALGELDRVCRPGGKDYCAHLHEPDGQGLDQRPVEGHRTGGRGFQAGVHAGVVQAVLRGGRIRGCEVYPM